MEEQVKRKLRLHGVLGKSGFEINDRVGRKQRVYVKIRCSIFNYRKTNN